MIPDFRLACRLLAKHPGFTAIAVLTMAVAIGACTALFSVMDAVLLRPLDFPQPSAIVRLWQRNAEKSVDAPVITWDKWQFFRDQQTVFSQLAISVYNGATVTGGIEPEQVTTLQASADFLPLLGLRPQLGRTFTSDEDKAGAPAVALISQHLWETRFSRDPHVLGSKIILDGVPTDIVGVLPARLPVPFNTPDVIQPRPYEVSFLTPQQRAFAGVWQVTGRLKPGVSRATAEAQLLQLQDRFQQANPTHLDSTNVPRLRLLSDEVFGNLNATFWVLAGAVTAVLLIACANIANLSLARLSARQKEIAVRLSLGAGRPAIIRQFLVESLVVAVAGGVLGVMLAAWSVEGIRLLAGTQLPRAENIALDPTALAFGLGVTSLTALLVGLYPAIQATRTDVQTGLKDTGRGAVGGVVGRPFRSALIVCEVALSMTLLVCAGLLVLSFARLQSTDLGFTPAGVGSAVINLPQAKYPTPELAREFYGQLQDKLDQAPELAAGGAASVMPLTQNGQYTPYSVLGRPVPPISERPLAGVCVATPGFFPALGIQLQAGRFFTADDHSLPPGPNNGPSPATGVCLINAQLAAKLFPGRSAVGQTLLFGMNGEVRNEVVGVIRNVKTSGIAQPVPDEIYFPRSQRGGGFMTVVARSKPGLTAHAAIAVIRRLVNELDPTLAIATPATADDLARQSVLVQQMMMTLLLVFAGIAALMATVGIYSVMAHTVAQRTNEIGVRLALGATAGNILRLLLRGAAGLLALGLVLGLAGAFGASRLLQEALYEVKPFDPAVFATVAAFFTLTAAIACLVPARRATRVDPIVALRTD